MSAKSIIKISFIFLGEGVYANYINYHIDRTNNNWLHLISRDQPIDVQLHLRMIKCVIFTLISSSSLKHLIARLYIISDYCSIWFE